LVIQSTNVGPALDHCAGLCPDGRTDKSTKKVRLGRKGHREKR
jgi:hypothetical protein